MPSRLKELGLLTWLALAAPPALALPSASLSVPRLSLSALFGQTAPPVALPEQTQAAQPPGWEAAPAALDRLRLRDGRELQGHILSQVQEGFLFHDPASNASFVVPFGDIVDLQRAGAVAPQLAPPQLQPPARTDSMERRFFLESSLRDLAARYEALSIWPGIESIAGGALGIAVALLIVVLLGTDTFDAVLAVFSGAVGAVSLIAGLVSLVSVENRKGLLRAQMDAVQDQLSQLPRAVLFPGGASSAVVLRF